MHANEDFCLHDITKIEGHADLEVKLRNGIVEKCEFRVKENHRFFESMAKGRSFEEIPLIVSRICGLCCYSHLHTAIKACENALNVSVSDQTSALRNVASNMEHLKSHVLHLYMLALPDYLGKQSVLDFDAKQHKHIHDALDIKKAVTDVLDLLAARTYHTVNARIGGFSKLPLQSGLDSAKRELSSARKKILGSIELFASFENSFERPTRFAALSSEKYELLDGDIKISDNTIVPEKDFLDFFNEIVVPYSSAKEALFKGREYMVGALARINLNREKLCSDAKKIINDLKLSFPSFSPFHNNVAQAIEMLHALDSSIEILDSLKIRHEPLQKIKAFESTGIGVTEAPRGLLFHSYSIDSRGIINNANIVVPTNQNNKNIEADLRAFIPSLQQLSKEKAELEIEKLIRAYDPCISCSTHFLKVKWS